MSVVKIQLSKGQKLSDYKGGQFNFSINGLPTGIINKKYTGIGATHCEIVSQRNSIIVSPTRSLAESKYLEWKAKETINGLTCFYLGGGSMKVKDEDIVKFNKSRGFKKVFAVADSFPRIVNVLGKEVYNEFALVVDEIDTFQQDTSYRSSLEFVIDYFWNFKKKTVVTATLIEFSDSNFKPSEEFPLFEIEVSDYPKKSLNLYLVDDQVLGTANLINQLCLQDSSKKIFIALNSVSYINKVIKTLLEDPKFQLENFGILCSEDSRNKILKGVEKVEIIEGKLPKLINFATSAFFVGVDILEPIHLIVCNSNKGAHSVLFPEKILQIFGRARGAVHSLNLISFRKLTNPFISGQFPYFDKKTLIDQIEVVKSDLESLSKSFNGISDQSLIDGAKKGALENSQFGIEGFLRFDYRGNLAISDFTVDYKVYNSIRAREYEKGINPLLDYLSELFEIEKKDIYFSQFKELSSLTSNDLVESFLDSYYSRILKTSQFFPGTNTSLLTLFEAEDNIKNKSIASLLLQVVYFKYLYGDESFGDKIKEFNSKSNVISKFARTLKTFKLRDSELFYKSIKSSLKLNEEYTVEKLKVIFYDLFALKNNNSKNHISEFIRLDMIENDLKFSEMLNDLFIVKKRRVGKKKETVYSIMSYDSVKLSPKIYQNSFRDELDRKLGVDHKTILLSVSNELLNSMIS